MVTKCKDRIESVLSEWENKKIQTGLVWRCGKAEEWWVPSTCPKEAEIPVNCTEGELIEVGTGSWTVEDDEAEIYNPATMKFSLDLIHNKS